MASAGASDAEQMAGKDLSEWEAARGIHVGINATYGPWSIRSTRGPIGDKAAMEGATASLGFDPPEMYFVHNVVELKNSTNGLVFRFHAEDALKYVLAHDERTVKVAAAKHWRQSKSVVETLSSPDAEVHQAHDWTFSTRYSGSASMMQGSQGGASASTHKVVVESSTSGIDFAKVGDTSEPIEQSDDVDLFESELDDNGQARYHVKIRCMPSRTYILARFWLRVDKVLLRAFETRVWLEHSSGELVREYSEREVPWGTLKAMGLLTLTDSSLARREDEACTHMEQVGDKVITHIKVVPIEEG